MPPAAQQHTSQFKLSVGGAELAPALANLMSSVVVDQSLHVPDMLEAVFLVAHKPAGKGVSIEDLGVKLASEIKVKIITPEVTAGEEVMVGEVTALEVEQRRGGGLVYIVRALDKSNRLTRGRITEAYKNMSYSDVAKKVAQRAGLKVGTVDSSTPVHDHVVQANVSDWHFLRGLADEIGYEVDHWDGKLDFRKASNASKGPAAGTMATAPTPQQLVWGVNLLAIRATVTAAEQVGEVEVRGWDMKQQKAMVGKAKAETNSAANPDAKAAKTASKFGDKKYVSVYRPFTTEGEVTAAAKALADQIAGTSTELEGTARGNPKLRPGTPVSVGLLGKPFDGKYVISSARHSWTKDDGYTVGFRVSGRNDRSLFSLGGGGAAGIATGPNDPVFGVVIGIVTDNNDPDKLGRVKVKFPWLADTYATDWARVVAPGAGKDRGMVIYPEVNDEVLVAFEHGDVRRPYVIGGLYNGKAKPKELPGLVKAGKVERRGFISRKGHKLVFLDGDTKSGLMMGSSDNKFRISLNATKKQIRIISDGKIEIEAKDDIKIESQKNINIKAAMKLKLEAGADLEAKAPKAKIDGGGMTEIKGGVIKLN